MIEERLVLGIRHEGHMQNVHGGLQLEMVVLAQQHGLLQGPLTEVTSSAVTGHNPPHLCSDELNGPLVGQ